ncbi:MAG: SMC-Scp complex subunit ScpB [Bacteroidetes bacterium]|jgi:segregation and condensation protein B|nr:SMC-Scp complex subunit ScpB [Bacteroidota bacterium]
MSTPLERYVEALVFAAPEPLSLSEIKKALTANIFEKIPSSDVDKAIHNLKDRYESETYAFQILEIGGKYQFVTKGAYHRLIEDYLKLSKGKRLSKAALETLSIIAYKQPIVKSEIELIRGVNCDYTVQKLLEKELIEIDGRSDGPGRPLLYATSEKFMNYFGLKSIKDLPQLKDFEKQEEEIGRLQDIEERINKN